jgi:hypothetical protein
MRSRSIPIFTLAFTLALVLQPLRAGEEPIPKLEDCASKSGSAHNYCLAIATLDAKQCELIANLDLRLHCILRVRDASRAVFKGK